MTIMRTALTCCLLLTAIVVHTCVRIELLNTRNGNFLPRTDDGVGNPKWRVAATSLVRPAVERSIALDRYNEYVAANPDAPFPALEDFVGPPYTQAERLQIADEIKSNALQSDLHWWVSGWGLMQYILAPVGFVLSMCVLRLIKSASLSAALIACAALDLAALCFALYRGYFTSLGW